MDVPKPAVESRFRVQGMDCASCVSKIENALARFPDVSVVSLNFASQTLLLRTADPAVLETASATLKKLGYPARLLSDEATKGADADETLEGAWWKSPKAYLVWFTGLLFATAFLVSWLAPEL